jgi:flagellar biosynthesis/type III secretory pathway ATPase
MLHTKTEKLQLNKKMDKRSTHYGDVVKWIEKVIDSCETYQQTLAAEMLIVNFGKQMSRNKVDTRLMWGIRSSLDLTLTIKRDKLIKQLES